MLILFSVCVYPILKERGKEVGVGVLCVCRCVCALCGGVCCVYMCVGVVLCMCCVCAGVCMDVCGCAVCGCVLCRCVWGAWVCVCVCTLCARQLSGSLPLSCKHQLSFLPCAETAWCAEQSTRRGWVALGGKPLPRGSDL